MMETYTNNTFKEILENINVDSEEALWAISDKIFIDKPIEIIKEQSTKEAFNLFIGVQIIGCWKSGGWAVGVFGNFPEIIPYAYDALNTIGLNNVANKVSDIIKTFPEGTDFRQNNQDYCDVINFLEGHERFIKDKCKFEKYSEAEKLSIRKNYIDAIESAEKLTDKIWSYENLECWSNLTNYLKKNINARLWK
jgi:hypothetical protein